MKLRVYLLAVIITLVVSGCASPSGGAATPAPIQADVQGASTGKWETIDRSDPSAPAILSSSDHGYALKTNWAPATIEYLYGWWGLGSPGDDHQIIEKSGSAYLRNGDPVPQADIDAFIASLQHLYPTQQLLSWQEWTDDYPQWTVEITGSDGQHILLDASSTGNPGNGPWNVLYNGRLYAQYDGAIGAALGKLFGGRLARGDSGPFGTDTSGLVKFSARGLPPQLLYGFWGLVPISNGFSYAADPQKGEITGQVTGQSRIGGMEIGDIDKLGSVKLTTGNGGAGAVDCKIEDLPEGDSFTPVTRWKFTCPVAGAKEGAPYKYALVAQFGSNKGNTSEAKGELIGTWQAPDAELVLPPPTGVSEALESTAAAKDLLTDHKISGLLYTGVVKPDDPTSGVYQGEAILLGETVQDGKPLRYTIGTPFIVDGKKLTFWDLDRTVLTGMRDTILGLPTSRRVSAADPNFILNIWYAKSRPQGERFKLYGQDGTRYVVKVNPCGPVKGGLLPSATTPLEGFSYNGERSLDYVDFVLIDGQPVVANLDIDPLYDKDPVRQALLPAEFNTGSSRAFARVWMQSHSQFERPDQEENLVPGDTVLSLYLPENVTSAERDAYRKTAKALPGTLEESEGWWTVKGMTFVPKEDGLLTVVGCSK